MVRLASSFAADTSAFNAHAQVIGNSRPTHPGLSTLSAGATNFYNP